MQISVQSLCERALRMVGRGDKNPVDELNQAVTSLNFLLAQWRLRGVSLFDLQDAAMPVPILNVVSNDGHNYLCIRTNSGYDSTSEPGTGAQWESYWKRDDTLTADGAWSATAGYYPGSILDISTPTMAAIESLANLRIVQEESIYPVELVDRDVFAALDPLETGIPSKANLLPGPLLKLALWPTPDESNLNLYFTAVLQPDEQILDQQVYLGSLWPPALQYGLAAELASYYALPADGIGPLVQKAEIEFKRALGSDKGRPDRCFVDPCF